MSSEPIPDDAPAAHALTVRENIEVTLVRVVAPHFVAGMTIRDGQADRCAPILHYMRGWTLSEISAYCAKKKWRCSIIPEKQR